ncbi:MAG: hypothetical protein ACE5F5_12455 [Acidimicrobiia bacterium]
MSSTELLGFSPKLRAAVRQHVTVFNPGAAAADATEEWALLAAEKDLMIHRVSWIPKSAVTGQATNYFNLNVINAGSDGLPGTEIGNVDYASGTNASADQENVIVSSDQRVSAGDVIVVQRELVGTGLAMPEGAFSVVFSVLDSA